MSTNHLALPSNKLGSDKPDADKKRNYRRTQYIKWDTIRYLGGKYLGVRTATSSYPARASYVCNDRGLCWLVKSTPQAIIHISNNPISIRCTKKQRNARERNSNSASTQPASDSEHEWSCAQARSASSTRAWYRKLIFPHFSLILEVMAFVAYVAAMPTRYQWGISAFLGMLETSFIGMFVIPALVFLYIFICLQLEDFFLLKHQSVAFAWIT
ncbi:hypothetical protein V8E51_018481 [Hyaloscypha variabilis]